MLLAPALLTPGLSLAKGAGGEAEWTYMVYMAGDGNLEHWLIKDIGLEFGKIGSTPEVNIVLLSDRHPGYGTQEGNWTDTRIFYVQKGDNAESIPVANWGERNTGDPQTLVEHSTDHYRADDWFCVRNLRDGPDITIVLTFMKQFDLFIR